MSLVRRTCSVGPTDSRRPSHAPLAYDGNMVAYATEGCVSDLKGLTGVIYGKTQKPRC